MTIHNFHIPCIKAVRIILRSGYDNVYGCVALGVKSVSWRALRCSFRSQIIFCVRSCLSCKLPAGNLRWRSNWILWTSLAQIVHWIIAHCLPALNCRFSCTFMKSFDQTCFSWISLPTGERGEKKRNIWSQPRKNCTRLDAHMPARGGEKDTNGMCRLF